MAYETTDIRTVAFVGHGGCGKTSLAEAILFCAKAIDRLGKVDAGTTSMDFDPEEIKRNISISTSFFDFEWKKKKVNLIDTPGDADFNTDSQICLSVADNAVIVVDAVGGVEIQTERMWKRADELGIPKAVFISKLDRERADFERILSSVKSVFKCKVAVLTYPIGKEVGFSGVVDLFLGKALKYAGDASGKYDEADIPADLASTIETLRGEMIESIAESNDALLEKYLEGGEISPDELAEGLKAGFVNGSFVPVFCGSGLKNIGVHPLLDFIANSAASPIDRKPFVATNKAGQEVQIKADPNGPLFGPRLQDDRGSLRRKTFDLQGRLGNDEGRLDRHQYHERRQGAGGSDHVCARKGAEADRECARGRYRGRRQAQRNRHRRHAGRRREPGHLPGIFDPAPDHVLCHQAQEQGRRR